MPTSGWARGRAGAARKEINPASKYCSILSLCAGAEGMQDAARRTDEQSEAPEFVNP